MAVIAFVLLALVLLYVGSLSPSYAKCESDNDKQATQAEKNTAYYRPAVFFNCEVDVLNTNSGTATAIATLLLAWITYLLVGLGHEQSETARVQLRARVFPEAVGIMDGPTLPNAPVQAPSGCPYCRIIIKNYGNTPAYNVRHFAVIDVFPAATHANSLPIPVPVVDPGATVIGPGGTTNADRNLQRALRPFEIAQLATVGLLVIVFGRIEYADEFGEEHFTQYALAYAGAWPPAIRVNMQFMPGGMSTD